MPSKEMSKCGGMTSARVRLVDDDGTKFCANSVRNSSSVVCPKRIPNCAGGCTSLESQQNCSEDTGKAESCIVTVWYMAVYKAMAYPTG